LKKYSTLLFDLDGTLVDSFEGVANSITHALKRFGVEPESRDSLRRYLGPPLIWIFRNIPNLAPENAELAMSYCREYYREIGIHQCSLYPGIRQALKELSEAGFRLAVATSKLEAPARQILNSFGIADLFSFIAGADVAGTRTEKEHVVRFCLESIPDASPETALMIGDRLYDVEGARAVGLDTLGVLWGFGDEEELVQHGAIGTVAAPDKILAWLRA
jgi:phosphoglycolate phosphatase